MKCIIKMDVRKVILSLMGDKMAAIVLSLTVLTNMVLQISGITFQSPDYELRRMLRHPSNGDIYVGGVNKIYHFNSDLSIQSEVVTGPKKDNPKCQEFSSGWGSCTSPSNALVNDMDNYNKLLVIDESNSKIITCGSLYQGTCEVRDLNNIKEKTDYYTLNDGEFTIAPNSGEDRFSVVAYAGMGPVCSSFGSKIGEQNVLYVGSSNTAGNVDLRSNIRRVVPIVSSHKLDMPNTFKSVFIDPSLGTESTRILKVAYSEKETNLIQFKSGFKSGDFSYFLTIQPDQDGSQNYVSKIIQICQSDCSYQSYIEIPITCTTTQDGITYQLIQGAKLVKPGSNLATELNTTGDILVAIFSQRSDVHYEPTSKSAVCIYTMKDVIRRFRENKQSCFNGQGSLATQFGGVFADSCSATGVTATDDYCHTKSENSPISGPLILAGATAITYSDVTLTSVELDVIDRFTVGFFGTSSGHLKRVLFRMKEYATEYKDDIIEEGAAIQQDMVLSQDRNFIFVMTSNKIDKVPVADCSSGTNCNECKELQNPYCGWCSLEKKCSERQYCQNYDQTKRWSSLTAWCMNMGVISPKSISIARQINIDVNIAELPPLQNGNKYNCRFVTDSDFSAVEGIVTNNLIKCPAPNPPLTILVGLDNIQATLYIESEETDVRFLESDVVFYDCSVHTACSSCATSEWNCHWCIHDNKCVDTSQCEVADSIIVSEESQCPQVLNIVDTHRLIPAGVRKDIIFNAKNLPVPKGNQAGYECLVNIGNNKPLLRVEANLVDSDTVECRPYSYNFSNDAEVLVPVDIVWNNNFMIENRQTNQATVYRCELLGKDCSSCLNLRTTHNEYNCKFCGNKCQFGETCILPVEISCPPPDIENIHPLSGPIEGGTLVTITGVNLGIEFSQVEDAVMIGTLKCDAIEERYEVSTTIVCRTRASGSPQSARIQVTVKKNNEGDTVAFSLLFQYKNPLPISIAPVLGPKSGGTLVTIEGTDLDTGAETVILIGDVNCEKRTVTDSILTCLTDQSNEVVSDLTVKLSYDNSDRFLPSQFTYEYTMDPEVINISPMKSYQAGGRLISVQGNHLNVVQRPQIFYKYEDVDSKYYGNCTAMSASQLICESPVISDTSSNIRKKRQTPSTGLYTVGLIMDGVASVQNLDQDDNISSSVEIVPNPVYFKFTETQEYKGDPTLELSGSNLNDACTKEEVTVYIGEELCTVSTLSNNKLYCQPPEIQPAGQSTGKLPEVRVTVGNLEFLLGEIEYITGKGNEAWIIGVAIGGGILLTLIIIILVVYKRKSTKAERQYKKLQMQLDTLESNVRNECKQAFAELQTEVSDFTSDISIIGIPIWDYKTYTFKVLFPSHQDHPVMHTGPEYLTNKFGGYDQGIHQFSQLLNSKHFMIIFIRTLEQQKNFGVRDKAVVASLLMIVLQDKMEYATDILKALMGELIDRSVEKKHPKLMLRRTESVVEKLLTNWLSICMYSYLKKHAGKELFMLYQAIKRQTEKGPVDALTSEARYSLSEDRLLREKIEPKTLNIHLVTDGEREPVTCKVLDCDTITQAKQKALDAIYLNTPFSHRPSIYDIDLEWRSGKSGHLPLQDEDVTTEVIHGWKKVNTLLHYHVPDGAVMALVQKRFKTDGVRQVHGRIEITGSNGMQPIVTMEEGQKVWHLLKHDDGQYVSRQQKVISEIFLTRLLATKGTLQQYIDELFLAILRVDSTIPPAIKWLFDFLDESARRHGIHDPDVVHTWKSNSLPLRFWVNIIKNPEFVFDIHKSNIVDSCLSVIAQTFMDSCSTMEHRLGKDSPSNKLLFAKDIPRYRTMVSKFYRGIQESQPVTDQAMNQLMTEMSLHYTAEFNVSVALKELFKYAHQYNFELLEALDEDPSARKFHLANKFEEVTANLEGSNY